MYFLALFTALLCLPGESRQRIARKFPFSLKERITVGIKMNQRRNAGCEAHGEEAPSSL
jgi:hypothetical protein